MSIFLLIGEELDPGFLLLAEIFFLVFMFGPCATSEESLVPEEDGAG